MAQSLEAALLYICEGEGAPSSERMRVQHAGLTVPVPGNDSGEWASAIADALGDGFPSEEPRSGTYLTARETVACPSSMLDAWVQTLFAPFESKAMEAPRVPAFAADSVRPGPLVTIRAPALRPRESGIRPLDFDAAALRVIGAD